MRQRFYKALAGKTDLKAKRKVIGSLFIDVFQEEATQPTDIGFLGQGTIYPDMIESVSSCMALRVTIKSHHNVGLPSAPLDLIEPLRSLFRRGTPGGRELGIPTS